MSTVVSTSIRRLSLLPVAPAAQGTRTISEIPPPIALAEPPRARRVAFFDLSPIVQERFESAIGGTFPPSPLLRSLRTRTASRPAWLASSAAACAAGVLVAARGFGALGGQGALQPAMVTLLYGVIAATIVYALARAFDVDATSRALPWPAGIYVFPTTLVDARTATLDVLPLLDLAAVETDLRARRVRLVFTSGRSFAFVLGEGEDVARAAAEIEDARARAKELATNADASACALADPLFESPEAPPVDVEARRAGSPSRSWTRRAGWLALAAGIVAGPAVHRVRDDASDGKAFRQAMARDDVGSWRAYLANGGAHRAEVEAVLLPRAEARVRREALLADLDRATAEGTLAALDAFVAAHPDDGLDVEIRDARHAVFTRALDRYRTHAPNDEAMAFVARVLAFAESHGPRIAVTIARDASPRLAEADAAVEGSNKFAGLVSHPSPWLDAADDAASRAAFVEGVRARFADVFPAEILDVVAADASTDPTAVATLVVRHHVDWSNDLVVAPGFPGVLVGARFVFDAAFVVPDGGSSRGLSTTIAESPDATSAPAVRDPSAPAPERAIYAAMTTRAFDAVRADVLHLLF
jgi:hypothetical protein